MELEQQRQSVLEVAEAIAPGWERHLDFVEGVCAAIRRWMIRELDPRPGDTVLELAAGGGDTGFEAARSVGERGRLICSDLSPAMVDVARRRGETIGVGGEVDFRVIDAQRIGLADDSVDGVLCRLGYMLMIDSAAALAETRRVLRPGGRLALAVWGAPERNPFFTAVAGTLIAEGHMQPPGAGAGLNIFSMAGPERVQELLEGAGFDAVRVTEIPVRFRLADLDEYLTITSDTAGPIAMVLQRLSDRQRAALETSLEQALRPFAADGGYELPGLALAAAAT